MIEAAQNRRSQQSLVWNEGVTDLRFKDVPSPAYQPYNNVSVEINSIKAALFLQKHGLTPQQISQITLRLSGNNTLSSIAEIDQGGIFTSETKTLEVSADDAVRTYYEYCYASKEVALGKRPPNNKMFRDILITDRLPKYLSESTNEDRERRLTFAKRLIQRAIERRYNNTFRHEAQHAIDHFNGLLATDKVVRCAMVLTPSAIITGVMGHFVEKDLIDKIVVEGLTWLGLTAISLVVLPDVSYELSPIEFRARKFAEKTGKTEDEQEIVKFKFLR